MSGHRKLLASQRAPAALIDALEQGQPVGDELIEALRGLLLAVVENDGDVSEQAWTRLCEVGFSRAQALEVVLGAPVYTPTAPANRLTGTSE